MSRIDWQAYLDGSLSPDERAEAERELQESESARRELDGLKSFISGIREAGLSQRVPMDRLEAMIPKKAPRRWDWRIAGPALAAAAVLTIYFAIPRGPSVHGDMIETSDPVVAANWVQPEMPFKVPPVRLGGGHPLVLLHHTKTSCCFDFNVDGSIYHVNVLDRPMKRRGREVTLATGITAYATRGVEWSQGDLVFFVVGPDLKTSIDVASAASQNLAKT